MATRRPLVLIDGMAQELPVEDTLPGGGVAIVRTPDNISPADGATIDIETPTFTGSAYRNMYATPQDGMQVQVSTSAVFASIAYDSGVLAADTSHKLPAGKISTSTAYYWRLRYRSSDGDWSAWSVPTGFATAATFNVWIPTPTPTPANFGDPLEGGFYAGMVWQQIAQSSTSMALGTGSKTFAVPNMTSAPIVYAGQQVEVRSRANPGSKFVGTVAGASGTSLTINVTSVGGTGTFSDWSVMARHRIIVAPKASGTNASTQLKNANTALPVACRTLTDGWLATNAMRDADTSTVYPAAHWARDLSIGGRTDWYIPARDELELLWRNLKPTTNDNYATADRGTSGFDYQVNGAYGDVSVQHGYNRNSAPTGSAYTTSSPGQTSAAAFKTGGAEALDFGSGYYFSSTEFDAIMAWVMSVLSTYPGFQGGYGKSNTVRARAVRRSII